MVVISEPYKPLNILEKMIVKILGNIDTLAYKEAVKLVKARGMAIWDESYYYANIAIAPLLETKLSNTELNDPILGTLIFHPSPLPYGRGASAIRHAYRRKEPISAATWFWANDGMDAGDICEQEIVKINYDLRPRELYEEDIIPAMLRTLDRALTEISKGNIRKIPQIERYSTFDNRII